MVVHYEALLNIGLSVFNLVGLDFVHNSILNLRSVLCVVLAHVFGFAVLAGFFVAKLSFIEFADSMLSVITLAAVMLKMITVVTKRSELRRLVENINQFWSIEDGDRVFALKVNDLMRKWNFTFLIFKYYIIFITSALTMWSVTSKNFIFKSYNPEGFARNLFLIMNVVSSNTMIIMCGGFDIFTSALLILLLIQFKILNYTLTSMDYSVTQNDNNYSSHIRKCVVHHNFLLGRIHEFNQIFGTTILIYVYLGIIGVCVVALEFTVTLDIGRKIQCICFILGTLLDFFIFYCLPGELLQAEIFATVNSIYESNFYECMDTRTKRSLLLIMTRANKETYIYGGKILAINLPTFTFICKTIYTVFTALQNVNNN